MTDPIVIKSSEVSEVTVETAVQMVPRRLFTGRATPVPVEREHRVSFSVSDDMLADLDLARLMHERTPLHFRFGFVTFVILITEITRDGWSWTVEAEVTGEVVTIPGKPEVQPLQQSALFGPGKRKLEL